MKLARKDSNVNIGLFPQTFFLGGWNFLIKWMIFIFIYKSTNKQNFTQENTAKKEFEGAG